MTELRLVGRRPRDGRCITVSIRDGVVAEIEPARVGRGEDVPFIGPALIDLQVNGYAGLDLNAEESPNADTVIALAHRLQREGVGAFLPTLITGPKQRTLEALRAIAAARRQDARTARMIPGIHVEGPFIAPEDGPRGAHPAAHVRLPSQQEYREWRQAAEGLVRMVTLCPAQPGALDLIRVLAADGVIAAIGHSNATPDIVHAAAEAGATLSTHLGNGVAGTLPRHPNLIWAQLADDRLQATFIADGHHLPPDTLKAMLRAKGASRCIVVSDVVAIGGLAPGRYRTPVGGEVELSAAGRLSIPDTPYLAGAALLLRHGVATVASACGFDLATALSLATEAPGALLGGRGRLAVGDPADLFRFRWRPGDPALQIVDIHVGGEGDMAE